MRSDFSLNYIILRRLNTYICLPKNQRKNSAFTVLVLLFILVYPDGVVFRTTVEADVKSKEKSHQEELNLEQERFAAIAAAMQ